jgi:hypothetical protein
MKRIVETDNTSGLENLMGSTITLFCCRYIYTGELVAMDNDDLELKNAKIVYETGALNTTDWKDAQALPNRWFVTRQSVESYGILK